MKQTEAELLDQLWDMTQIGNAAPDTGCLLNYIQLLIEINKNMEARISEQDAKIAAIPRGGRNP